MSKDTVNLEVMLSGPVEKVWQAWTDPVVVLKWIGSDPNGRGVSAVLDVHEGGKYTISFANADGGGHTFGGVYKEVAAPHTLSFTWEWENEPGVESFVTVLLVPEGGRTRMAFEHARVGFASAHDYAEGWIRTFDKLERVLKEM
ncbi:MAG TPA: SRPBCC domain-containing protein [Puia sp.]|nr:SRPBCC domain-containing protein [Puia sp.]